MKIGVVGAGLMGAEIALVFALAGHEVTLTDREHASLDRAMDRLRALAQKGVERGNLPPGSMEAVSKIRATAALTDLEDRELVTEAIFEDLPAKTALLETLASITGDECVLTSNTSTIPISTLAAALPASRRTRFLGTHYFSPVSRMRLVEVIPGFETAEATTRDVATILASVGKVPIRVKDVAGFAVNRMLHAFLIEAVRLVEEGVATPEDLDTACRLGLGHPIGPFALMDVVSSTLCVQVQEIMQECYGERFRPPPLMKQRIRAGYGGGRQEGWLSRTLPTPEDLTAAPSKAR